MQEERIKQTLYSVKEFIGDNMSAIQAEVSLTKYMEKGLMRWVSTDSTLKISDGRDVIDLDIDFWEKDTRQAAIDKLKRIGIVINEMTEVLEKLMPEIELLDKEAEANREILYNAQAISKGEEIEAEEILL